MPSAPPGRSGLRPLDLTGRERQLRTAMKVMGRIATRFARTARRTLPFIVRRRTRLLPQPVAIADAMAGVAAPVEGPRVSAALEAEDSAAWGSVALNAEALALVLEGSLGGTGNSHGPSLGSELTLAQRALARRLARSLAEDFSAAVRGEAGLTLRVTSDHCAAASEPLQLPDTDGLMVDCVFEDADGAPTMTITVGAEALQAAAHEQDDGEPVPGDPRMAEAVQEVSVEATAELGRVSLGLRSVLALRVGQVIRLGTAIDDEVPVHIAGIPKLAALPVVSRGQLSVRVRGRLNGRSPGRGVSPDDSSAVGTEVERDHTR